MCEYTHNFLVGSNDQLTLLKMFVFRMLQNGCMNMCKSRAVDVVFSGLVCGQIRCFIFVCVFSFLKYLFLVGLKMSFLFLTNILFTEEFWVVDKKYY